VQVPFNQHPPAKDETDLELALLLAVEQGFNREIWLFGLLGGRLDQTLANVLLLTHPALANTAVTLFTPYRAGLAGAPADHHQWAGG
jgi:thiamine pyrophosphokinase